jgi:hypothetical protein
VHTTTVEVKLLLLCGEEDCKRFEKHLREIGISDRIRSVHSAEDVARALETASGSRRTSLIVVDPEVQGGWDVIRWLKRSSYRRVPLLVVCDDENCEDAYDHGANGVVQRKRWSHQTGRVASAVGNFWLGLARLPPLPEVGDVQTPQRFLRMPDPSEE